ncbi:hypothetical protein KQX54_016917 [Cotesia glomerata]|uniref:Uncharacterized protein n=1 Tax=Cotesia glomerata TaxID=32391 RepID=A0AAV7I9E8_COTGL|nr:hypothetical protein KQX54_016917 [Cotesia glomerata]
MILNIFLGPSHYHSMDVEMTGSSVFDYVHQQDHAEVAEQLGLGLTSTSCASVSHSSNSGLASPNSTASEEHNANSTANPDDWLVKFAKLLPAIKKDHING